MNFRRLASGTSPNSAESSSPLSSFSFVVTVVLPLGLFKAFIPAWMGGAIDGPLLVALTGYDE
jgi:hypothetical protein